ncbi:phage tail protein [Janthinobacterium sp. PAMC25594]|uniref:phage tail protein n=1 Tax=Janthinobacterium sp. PAMC25594 TaxID=2861284 RepID=UPI001C630065|nr:phage tail protein [Janthinobacterium sp. PAMC25594]QYG09010.1 phage tail protein [Janthinobacterium sp. PAMC25594]
MSTYFAILTEVGEAKLANAIALGQTLKLKNLAVGDGNGNLPMPVRTQKALVREVRRAGLNQLSIDPANTSQIIVEQVLPEDVGGWWIREIGIFDEAGDLCAVANCPPSYKPLMMEGSGRTQVVRIVLIVASTAAIELKIDPSIILATRKYVDDQDIVVRAYSDEQLAKHLAAVDPHPLLAKLAYVDQQDTNARTYGDQQLARHQAALDPHPLLAKVAYVDQQDTSARTYGDQQLAKHQTAADPHPLLAKVAYVDQQDTSARAYGDQQLAKHLAAADPHSQYSMKEIVTPPKFDASNKLANTDYVQRAQGNMVRYNDVIESRTLTAEDIGCALYFPYADKAITIPDPVSLGIPNNSGKCVKFFGLFNTGTILAAPGVIIGFDVGNVPTITIKPGQFLTLMATATNVWQVIDSTAELWRNADFANYFNNVAPTPARFDVSTRIATTEALKRSGITHSASFGFSAAATLTAEQVGGFVYTFGTGGFTLNLPSVAGLPTGSSITYSNQGGIASMPVTCAAQGGNTIQINGGVTANVKVAGGDSLTFVVIGANEWAAIGTGTLSASASFGASTGTSGYQKLPSGLILQWGTFISPATPGADVAVSFTIAFTTLHMVLVGASSPGTSPVSAWWKSQSPIGFVGASSSPSTATPWIAIGR